MNDEHFDQELAAIDAAQERATTLRETLLADIRSGKVFSITAEDIKTLYFPMPDIFHALDWCEDWCAEHALKYVPRGWPPAKGPPRIEFRGFGPATLHVIAGRA